MHSSSLLSTYCVMLTLLRLITTQNDQPALMFQGIGFAGSVVAATGCDITYELEYTAGTSVCISHTDVVKTVTLNGPSSYAMTYYWTSSTDAGPLTETLYDTCTLLGTTAANCHAIVTVTVAGESISSASPSIDTESASLGYAQIPITAGLAAALRSVSSCSANSGVVTSSPVDTTASVYSRVHSRMSATGKASPVTYAGAGLSTGTKVGIGVGVGIGGAALLVVGEEIGDGHDESHHRHTSHPWSWHHI